VIELNLKSKQPHNVLGKIASDLSKIINKRGWFNKDEKKKLKEALKLLNEVLGERMKKVLKINNVEEG